MGTINTVVQKVWWIYRTVFSSKPHPDTKLAWWHKYKVPILQNIVLTNGEKPDDCGQVWRRQLPDGSFEYKQDVETDEDYDNRMSLP